MDKSCIKRYNGQVIISPELAIIGIYMKDNLFEMLLNLFEKSLAQIQKSQKSVEDNAIEALNEEELHSEADSLQIKSPNPLSTRICIFEEQIKLTKASLQFLTRMKLLGILDADMFEIVMDQLLFSESRIVTLQETKWAVRNLLAPNLNENQLAFLDLVLYQKEDQLAIQ